jgi:hypothetical protein
MTTYHGSLLAATAQRIAREMQFAITLEPSDAAQNSTEKAVLWIQPEEGRYRYEPPRYQPTQDTSILDRYVAVDVIVRAPGSERAMLELSDAFLRATDTTLGAQPYNWRIDRDASGGGAALGEGAWIEQLRLLLRYDVIRDFVTDGAPLEVVTENEISGGEGTAESGLFVEGPGQGENSEALL